MGGGSLTNVYHVFRYSAAIRHVLVLMHDSLEDQSNARIRLSAETMYWLRRCNFFAVYRGSRVSELLSRRYRHQMTPLKYKNLSCLHSFGRERL